MKKEYQYEYKWLEDGWGRVWHTAPTLTAMRKFIKQQIRDSISIEGRKRKNYRIIEVTERIVK